MTAARKRNCWCRKQVRRSQLSGICLVVLVLCACLSACVVGSAFERMMDPATGIDHIREYKTHDEVVAEARLRGMTTQQFMTRAALDMQYYPFECPVRNETQTIYFACTEKSADNLCKGRDWYIYNSNGRISFYSGATGVDVCAHTTCKDMVCRNTNSMSSILQTFDMSERTPYGCSCLDPATRENNWRNVYYSEENPDYPWDDDEHCANVACLSDMFPEGGTVVYENQQCLCWYPKAIQRPIRYLFPGNVTETTREPSNTPDPAESDTTGPTVPTNVPTGSLDVDSLLGTRATPFLCPNLPPGLTSPILAQQINDFCCVMYINVKNVWSACGEEVFQTMPVGWAYCRSTIPSFEFCCEVEHMHRDTFVYRGDSCEVS